MSDYPESLKVQSINLNHQKKMSSKPDDKVKEVSSMQPMSKEEINILSIIFNPLI